MKTLAESENYLAIPEENSNLQNSKIVLLSAPYEETTSYGGGCAYGPEAIIAASAYVEFFDDEFERELCFEKGIATLEALDFTGRIDKEALQLIEKQCTELLEMDKFVVTLGGEHTISFATIAAHYKKYPEMSLLHFDAHSDLRQEYLDNKYSHACVMARVCEFFPPQRITQVGIRALCKEEHSFIKMHHISTFYASAIRKGIYGSNWQGQIAETLSDTIYVSFDIDFFDPSLIPATGTPEPDGFFYSETIDVFREIKRLGKKIIGFDLVELAPIADLHHCNLTAARLAYKLMNFAF